MTEKTKHIPNIRIYSALPLNTAIAAAKPPSDNEPVSPINTDAGEILNGKKCARENDDEIIYFNAVGAGILDLAVTTRCYKYAKENNIGIKLPFWED